jgi:hypothetical protein
MIHFERSADYDLVKRIITHPRLYRYLADDCSPPASEFEPQRHPAIWYVIVHDDEDLLGLWMFVPQNGICWEVHTALLPCAWGERGQLAARLLPTWMWHASACRRIITNVPENTRLALHFAYKAGMEVFGINRDSYLKNGVLEDQVMLGISKPAKPLVSKAETPLESIVEAGEEEACQ